MAREGVRRRGERVCVPRLIDRVAPKAGLGRGEVIETVVETGS